MANSRSGFTLIELLFVIIIAGILSAVAVVKYMDFRRNAADSIAYSLLGSLRSANSLIYSNRLVSGNISTYTMGDIASNVSFSNIQTELGGDRTLMATIDNFTYTYTMDTFGVAPTTLPSIEFGTGGGCFIATSAYGDADHPDVIALRRFRDRYLMKTELGQDMVRLYYRYSPFISRYLDTNPILKNAVRVMLFPIVVTAKEVCSDNN